MHHQITIIELISKLELVLNIQLFLVGGAVRDTLLGKTIKDWDFASPALPDEIELAVRDAGLRPYLIGKKYGTIGLKYRFEDNSEPVLIEITTFRGEVYAPGDRKPEVQFSKTIDQDLSRRDFTINAIAMDSKGQLIDPYNGQSDLSSKLIRTVGNPTLRFKEDPLRILRGVRIASQLGFEIESQTAKKITEKRFSLLNISKERWVSEIDRILSQPNPLSGLNTLMNLRLFEVLIPELTLQKNFEQQSPHHQYNLWEHTSKVIQAVPADQLELRWAALLHDVAKPMVKHMKNENQAQYIGHDLIGAEVAKKICWYLKFSNQRTNFICDTILMHLHEGSILKRYDDSAKIKGCD
ncbi:MAG: hypothetical protein OHK0017_06970 [Patescibacteria group bacterium]